VPATRGNIRHIRAQLVQELGSTEAARQARLDLVRRGISPDERQTGGTPFAVCGDGSGNSAAPKRKERTE
jgi:hypothetical protein